MKTVKSSDWQDVVQYLERSGLHSGNLNRIKEFFQIPDNPIAIARVFRNIEQLLTRVVSHSAHYTEHASQLHYEKWLEICSTVNRVEGFDRFARRFWVGGKMPLRGLYETHYLYVTVWEQPTAPGHRAPYFSLLAHCVLAERVIKEAKHETGRSAYSFREDYDSSFHNAYQLMRNLSKKGSVLESLPSLDIPPKELRIELRKLNRRYFYPLEILFKYLVRDKKPPHKSGGRQSLRSTTDRKTVPQDAFLLEVEVNADSDADGKLPPLDLMVVPKESSRELDRFGLARNESTSDLSIVQPRRHTRSTDDVPSKTQVNIASRQIKSLLSMKNQRLSLSWEKLTSYEVQHFLASVMDLVVTPDSSRYRVEGVAPSELAAMLATMFWLSQRPEKIPAATYRTDNNIGAAFPPTFFAEEEGSRFWLVSPGTPKRVLMPTAGQLGEALPTTDTLALFSGTRAEEVIAKHCLDEPPTGSSKLFRHKASTCAAWVADFLKKANREHKTRLTVNRVADHLFDQIATHEGSDLTTAMYIIGREDFLGVNPSFYTAVPAARLQATYRSVCERIARENSTQGLSWMPAKTSPLTPTLPDDIPSHVGSPFTPTQETVRELVQYLKDKLNAARNSPRTVEALMRLHNSMTRYTAYLIAFATGFRAIRKPFALAAKVDRESGFAILSDKDSEDQFNSRLVWLPPVCLRQFELFNAHRINAVASFSMLIPDLDRMLATGRRDWPGKYSFFVKGSAGSYETIPASPTQEEYKIPKYTLPFNASRHYLRSRLLDSNTPIEVINAFMGHFERGEEPWGRYSGLSPATYRRILHEKLVPLLREDGWEALPGLGAAHA